jgi:hypothetical protein
MPSMPSIGFFTVVMNRLQHLSITLPANLRDCTLENTKFLILDFGSTDGVADFLAKEFSEELASGRVQYHRHEAEYFQRSRARNIAAHLLQTDAICNLDADNFAGNGFDSFLQATFSSEQDVFVTALGTKPALKDALGKVAVRKEHFISAGGYNEHFDGYGFEDYQLVFSLEQAGLKKIVIQEQQHLQAISHGTSDRIAHEWRWKNLYELYTQHVDNKTRALLYLYVDGTAEYGLVIENGRGYKFSLAGKRWQHGYWMELGSSMSLHFGDLDYELTRQGKELIGGRHRLMRETVREKMEEAILFNTEIANRYRLHSLNSPKLLNQQHNV